MHADGEAHGNPAFDQNHAGCLRPFFQCPHSFIPHILFPGFYLSTPPPQDAYSMHKDRSQIFIKLAVWLRSKWRIDDSLELTNQLAHIFIHLERATYDWKVLEVALEAKKNLLLRYRVQQQVRRNYTKTRFYFVAEEQKKEYYVI